MAHRAMPGHPQHAFPLEPSPVDIAPSNSVGPLNRVTGRVDPEQGILEISLQDDLGPSASTLGFRR
jgi:hypothetical protein